MAEAGRQLRQGIEAAKSKDFARARTLLRAVLAREPDNVTAWLWLSASISDPLKQEACLKRILALQPDHAAAQRGLAAVTARIVERLLDEGLAAAGQGDRARAQEFFTGVIERDEDNLTAWIGLSRVVTSHEDQEICFENILTLDPEHREAQQGLALLRHARDVAGQSIWDAAAEEGDERGEAAASTLAGDILGEAYREKHTTLLPDPDPEPVSRAAELWAKYDDPYLCPYCAAPTAPEDRHCPVCRGRLWLKRRAGVGRSKLLWILIAMQASSTALALAAPFVVLFILSWIVGAKTSTDLLPIYLGLPHDLSPQVVAATLARLPRLGFFAMWLPVLLGIVMTVGLYARWRTIFYLLLANSIVAFVGSAAGVALLGDNLVALAGGITGLLLSVAIVITVIKLEGDFRVRQERLTLGLDRQLKSGTDYLLRGRLYAQKGLWALAALHFRRAAALSSFSPDGCLALARACVRLEDLDLARWALEEARARRPDDQRIRDVAEMLMTRSARETTPETHAS
jgi:tetratricopeptide (TPR) repeat protein